MLLSNYLLSGGVKPYLEFGWVTAPNTAGQSITANTITTLTIDTEIADTGNNGSISANQITLAAGTYYFKAHTTGLNNNVPYGGNLLSLYNVTNSSYVTHGGMQAGAAQYSCSTLIEGQFTITLPSVFELRFLCGSTAVILSSMSSGTFTLTTAGADQRTTIKLWKLA
jgi:hypothetical protein